MNTIQCANLIVGGGYLAHASANLLGQFESKTVVLETHPSIYNIASLRNQRMLNSGLTWYFDKAGDKLLTDFYINFQLTSELLGQPINDETIESYMVMSKTQLQGLKAVSKRILMHEYEEISNHTGCPLITDCLIRGNTEKKLVKIPDRPFDLAALMNGLRFYTEKYHSDSVSYRMIDNKDNWTFEYNNGDVRVRVNDTMIEPEKVFLCTGAGTFDILQNIVGNDVNTLTYKDLTLTNQGLDSEFTFQTDILPMYHIKYHNDYPDMLVNISDYDAFVRHGHRANYVSSRIKHQVPLIGNIQISESKKKELYLGLSAELIKNPFTNSDIIENWHCRRIERKFSRGNYKPMSVSNWISKCPSLNNVIFGLPGKASLTLTTSIDLIQSGGYDTADISHEIETGGLPYYNHIQD